MVFVGKFSKLKKILFFYSLFFLYNKNNVFANVDETANDNNSSYSQTVISEELGLTDNDVDTKDISNKKFNNNTINYQQPYQPVYQQPYPQQPMPIVINTPQPYYTDQNYNYNTRRQNSRKRSQKSRNKSEKDNANEKYIKGIEELNDKIIFSNNYNFGDYKYKYKSFSAFTFNWLSLQTLMIVLRIIKDKSTHNARFNVGGQSTWLNFLQDEFSEFKKDPNEEGDYTGGRSIGLWLKIIRALSNVKWEWKSIKNKYFAVGFELAHLIGPTCLLEFNTGYDKPNVFGGGIKIGLTCGLGCFLTGKLGNLYIKVDGPCFSLVTMLIALRNSTIRDDESNKRSTDSIFGKPAFDTIYKHLKSFWTFKRINTGWRDNMKDSTIVDVFESVSIGLGWIFPRIDLFEY